MRFGYRRAPPPASNPLDEVLEAERAAAEVLEAARREVDSWLNSEKDAIARKRAADLAALTASHAAEVDAARRDAAAAAAVVVAAAEAYQRELQSLRDDQLRPVVSRYLAAILPGGEP